MLVCVCMCARERVCYRSKANVSICGVKNPVFIRFSEEVITNLSPDTRLSRKRGCYK